MRLKLYTLLFSIGFFPALVGAQCTDLFISEYIEGTSNNKAIEIYNPTTAAINLASPVYSIVIYSNGSPTVSFTINLTGTINPGQTFVISNNLSGAALLALSQQTSTSINFNGDDAVALRKAGNNIDVIGRIGADPGTQWGVGTQSTEDNTIRRNAAVQAGDPNGGDVFDPTIEWTGFAADDFSGLGSHNINACIIVPPTITGGMILNEISNGTTGNQEYMEFVVIGSSADPLADVNLSGWIIDDNNGDFEGTTSTGIADGHVRIKSGFLTAVKPGSIILIYNNAVGEQNPSITQASDPTDANGDCIYVLRISDGSFEDCSSLPSTTNNSYSCGVFATTANWSHISLRNAGDAGQARKPNASFYHGFSYGDVGVPFPSFPTEFDGSAFNVATGDGVGRNFFFNCGSFTSSTNFSRGNAGTVDETPGEANNNANRYFINAVRTGTFDYSNLANPANCGTLASLPCATILAINLHQFNAEKQENHVLLNWELANSDSDVFSFELQRSKDAIDFYTIAEIEGYNFLINYAHTDYEPMQQNYYRLKMIDRNGEVTFSAVKNVNFDRIGDISIFPNPLSGNRSLSVITAGYTVQTLQIYNALGQQLFYLNNPQQTIELPAFWPAGFYNLILKVDGNNIVRKLVIE